MYAKTHFTEIGPPEVCSNLGGSFYLIFISSIAV